MPPAAHRIRSTREFTGVWKSGRAMRGRYCIVRIQSTGQTTKFGFVISKAIARKAVVRNHLKRRFRAITQRLPSPPPANIVIYATRATANATFQQLQGDIESLMITSPHAPTHR